MKLEDITAGYYTANHNNAKERVGAVPLYGKGSKFFSDAEDFELVETMIERGWTFTRLVSVKEVEKAYNEGCFDVSRARPEQSVNFNWEYSRAKRIAEGLQ